MADRPPVAGGPRRIIAGLREGANVVFRDVYLRWLVVSAWLIVGAAIATESIAVPYAAAHGGGARTAGLLIAALPVGSVIGALIVGRCGSPEGRPSLPAADGVGDAGGPGPHGVQPADVVTGVIWFAAGLFSAMQVIANREFVRPGAA